jgi:hypothetical protein
MKRKIMKTERRKKRRRRRMRKKEGTKRETTRMKRWRRARLLMMPVKAVGWTWLRTSRPPRAPLVV